MISKIFEKDNPLLWFLWPLLLIILWIPSIFFYTPTIKVDSLGLIYYAFQIILKPNWLPGTITFLVVLFQGYYLKYIFSKHSLVNSNSFYVPLIYCLTLSLMQFEIILNPFLFAFVFLLFAFDRLLELGKEIRKFTVFEASILIGIAVILSHNLIYFILTAWIALLLFKSAKIKEWIRPLIGLIIPLLYVFTYWIWQDKFITQINLIFIKELKPTIQFNIPSGSQQVTILWLIIVTILSISSFSKFLSSNIIRTKNSHLFFIWVLIVGVISTILTSFQLSSLLIITSLISTSFFTILATTTRKKWIIDTLILTAIILLLANSAINLNYL